MSERYEVREPAAPGAPYVLFDTLLGKDSSTHHTYESAVTRKYTLQVAAQKLESEIRAKCVAVIVGGAR